MATQEQLDWLAELAVADEAFSLAYAGLPGDRRAWVKQTVAQVHALGGGMPARANTRQTSHRQGFESIRLMQPVRCAVLMLDSTCASAPMAAAAAAAVSLSGAPRCLGVRLTGPEAHSSDVLAALELAGLELVHDLELGAAKRLGQDLAALGSCSVLLVGGSDELSDLKAGLDSLPELKCRQLLPARRLGLWADGGWNLDVLAWAQPGVQVGVYGPNVGDLDLPAGFDALSGDFNDLLNAGYDALYVPASRLPEALGLAPLVLGPGQEGSWAWPRLEHDFFSVEHLAMGGWTG